ncbi:hypothetical protein FCR2A7T_18230 [Flavobacterium cauense R2A-7]|nr:hypothetical protein FCR2A7T_18230 [Flavobacterium cauense R2A-7]
MDNFFVLKFFWNGIFIHLLSKFLKFKLNMKKIILSVAAVFAFGFANAQEEVKEAKGFGFSKGNIMVEGNLGFSTGKSTDSFGGTDMEETKTSSFNFNPKAGYFLTDKIAVGVELNLASGKTEVTDMTVTPNVTNEGKTNSFGAGVFARYYFLDLGQRFKTYAEAGLGFGSQKWETNGTETRKDSNFGLGIDLGMNYFVTEKMAINFGLANVLGFNSGKSEFPGGGETKSSSVNGNFNVFNNFFDTPTFGLTYKF